jgi:hypothetical protein
MIELKPEIFTEYISKLREHLFNDTPLQTIIQEVGNNHRSYRFISIYVLLNKKIFVELYAKRSELGIEDNFNAVIHTFIEEANNSELVKHFIERLGISEKMRSGIVSDYAKKVVVKDLKSYIMWARKQDPLGFIPPVPWKKKESMDAVRDE